MPSIAHLVEAVVFMTALVIVRLGIHARAYARLEEMKQPGITGSQGEIQSMGMASNRKWTKRAARWIAETKISRRLKMQRLFGGRREFWRALGGDSR